MQSTVVSVHGFASPNCSSHGQLSNSGVPLCILYTTFAVVLTQGTRKGAIKALIRRAARIKKPPRLWQSLLPPPVSFGSHAGVLHVPRPRGVANGS